MRKTRYAPTKRRAVKRTTRRKKSSPILIFDDILGVVAIGLGLATLVALCMGDSSGVLGQYVAPFVRLIVGCGAWLVPPLLALIGVMLIVAPLEVIPRNVGIGSGIGFVVFVTWCSLRMGDFYANPQAGGGWIGNGVACAIKGAFGTTIGYLVLIVLAIIALIIIRNAPLATTIEGIRMAAQEWREARAERLAQAQEMRAKTPGKPVIKKEEAVVPEGRKRTLASIFGKDTPDSGEALGEELVLHLDDKPPVKINASAFKREKPHTNDNGQWSDEEPVAQGEFKLPPTSLLTEPPPPPPRVESELNENIQIIERTLEEFKVKANVVEIACGPTVARYEIQLAPGIKVNKIVGLADNLAMQLAAIDVRVEAPIPGKAAIGVEVPNRNRGTVVLREIVESKAFRESASKLTFALGKDVAGNPAVADLAKMPHMLIGGATNAGKSVGLNALIASLLFRVTPDEMKFVLIDPKRVELTLFDGIPHLACPVVKDAKLAASVFRAIVHEMEQRYLKLGQVGARNIDGYNEKIGTTGERMPYMVVVVDELCDLMMQAAAEVEGSITRLAQLARATGIHLVIATQRPSVDVITGVIKANISSRIAFAVSSHHDSRTILDQKGAERLVGRGDMLFLPIDASKPRRIQGCYVSETEIHALCDYLKEQRKPIYTIQPGMVPGSGGVGDGDDDGLADEFYEPSIRFVVSTGYCSTSMLQRKFKVGYTRAARIVDTMEQQGIVGPLDGAKPRQVLVTKAELETMRGAPMGMRQDDFDEEAPPNEIIGQDEPDEEEEG